MRRIALIVALLVGLATPVAVIAAPANADPGSPKCMTLREWKQIKANGTMTRSRVKQIVGNYGDKGRTSHYSDGTIDFYVTYKQCGPNGRPHPYLTTMLAFETEVIYGDYVWDEYADYVEGHCVGGNTPWGWDTCATYSDGYWQGDFVWDEYAEKGVTHTPKVRYKGSF